MADEQTIEVEFAETPGIVNSDWLQLSPGITVVTGRNNAGKTRILTRMADLSTAMGEAVA